MAEPTAFPDSPKTEKDSYKPLSLFAIVGFALAAVFGAFMLIQVILGLISHAPVLMPALILLSVAAGIISLLGIWSIRRSDGTLAGMRLARYGWWIAVVSGLGYGAYYGATYMAIQQQANEFTMSWFDKLRARKFNAAFLDTQDPAIRFNVNPDDEAVMAIRFDQPGGKGSRRKIVKSYMEAFRDLDPGRRVMQGGEETTVEPRGVVSWKYEHGNYFVERIYRLKTVEGTFDVIVTTVKSDASNQGVEGPAWRIEAPGVRFVAVEWSPIGRRVLLLRTMGKDFLDEWARKITSRQLEAAYLDTVPPKDRARMQTHYNYGLVGALWGPCLAAPSTPAPATALMSFLDSYPLVWLEAALPGFMSTFGKGELLDYTKFRTDDEGMQAAVKQGLQNMLLPKNLGYRLASMSPQQDCTQRIWRLEGDRLIFPLNVVMDIVPGAGKGSQYNVEAIAWLETEPGVLKSDSTHFVGRLTKIEVVKATDFGPPDDPGMQ